MRPGKQSRKFTHVPDIVKACYKALKQNKNKHYAIAAAKSYSIIKLAKLFNSKIKYLPKRPGERYASALNSMNLNNKIHNKVGRITLEYYAANFFQKHSFTKSL